MRYRFWAVAAGFCVLAAPSAFAQKSTPDYGGWSASQHPSPVVPTPRGGPWPRVLPGKTVAPPAAAIDLWAPEEIELALARCTAVLKGVDAVIVHEPPLREGAECGTPAPVKLISVGRGQVTFVPPPTITCDLAANIAKWIDRDLQPLARKHLGAPIVRVDVMSSYSCRNAYGRAHGRISEHGKANAVDLASFVTTRGAGAPVLAEWGPTARQIAAEAAAAAKAAAGGHAVAKARVPAGSPPNIVTLQAGMALPGATAPADKAPTAAAMVPLDAPKGLAIGIPGITLDVSGRQEGSTFGLTTPPSRLGGPKPRTAAAEPLLAPGARTEFLRAAHRSACKVFHTVLGPEANNAHLNHFHLDMAERIKDTRICE